MNKNIVNRVIKESEYIIKTKKTIREIAMVFNVSKSTVHKDLKDRLFEIDSNMYSEVSSILKYHLNIRHIRGGNATKCKFLNKKIEI